MVALLAVNWSGADAATLIVQTSSYMAGISLDGPVGGTDYQGIATNTAAGDASAQFFSQMSIPGGTTSGFASGNVATGEMRAQIQTNPGTYFGGIDGVPVNAAQGSGVSEVLISETFIASGSGALRFDLAYDGFWDLAPQQYLSCCDVNGPVAGFFDPSWLILGSLTLAGSGLLSGETFFHTNSYDPDSGSVAGVLSAFGWVVEGREYGISMHLLTGILGGATGGINFANTAVLSFSTDPGVTLAFDDSRFLSQMAVIPLPASGLLLLAAAGALVTCRKRTRRRLDV